MNPRTARVVRWGLIASALLWSALCAAQEPYPSKPITMIVPFPPGGVADLTGRPTALAMSKALKQSIVIENKAGAGGGIGMAQVAKAKPDGYTIMMALSSISVIPEADKLLGRAPMYTLDQLAPIALVSADPTILVVRAESPWKSVKDFIDDAKKRPDAITYSSSGIYGTLHVAMAMLADAAGVTLHHVPFTGAGPAITALLGGHVDALATGPGTVVQHIRSGKLRALAGWGDKRIDAMPDLPTLKELGYNAEFFIWSGLFAPAGTPQPVLAALRNAAKEAVNDPQFKSAMAAIETPIHYLDAPEFQKFWDNDAKRLAVVVKKIGKVEEKP
ncbi:MAG: tripartite tricarboxylate transporter substrate binding protein [Betaproteobacteria bacterium]